MTSPLFSYVWSPTPVFTNASCSATLTVTNGSTSLSLTTDDEIDLTLPVGNGASDLTAFLTGVSPTPAADWRCSAPSNGSGAFIITPTKALTFAAGASLVFTFNKLTINNTPGTCEITVAEYIGDSESGSCTLSVSKETATLSITASASPTTVGLSAPTTLTWIPVCAGYVTISPGPDTHYPVDGDAQYSLVTTPSTDVPDEQQVTYTFTAWAASGGQSASTTATVTIGQPNITNFTSSATAPINYDDTVTLSWDVDYSESVMLTLPQGAVSVSPSGSMVVQPKTMLSGNESMVTYELRATGYGNPTVASVNIEFAPVAIAYFKFTDEEATRFSYEYSVTDGIGTVNRVVNGQVVSYVLTANGPGGPLTQNLGN